MTAACGDYVVGRSGLIQHRRNCLNILWRPPPIPLDSEIAERQAYIAPRGERGHRIHNLAGNKSLGTQRRVVIGKNSRARVHSIGLAVVRYRPECGGLRNGIRAARIQRRFFICNCFARISKALRRTGVIKPDVKVGEADGLEQAERAQGDAFDCLNRLLERKAHGTLSCQAENLVGPNSPEKSEDAPHVPKIQGYEVHRVVNSQPAQIIEGGQLGISRATPYFIAALEQELREIASILSGNSADQGPFGHQSFLLALGRYSRHTLLWR